jgi:hypothetical protein
LTWKPRTSIHYSAVKVPAGSTHQRTARFPLWETCGRLPVCTLIKELPTDLVYAAFGPLSNFLFEGADSVAPPVAGHHNGIVECCIVPAGSGGSTR